MPCRLVFQNLLLETDHAVRSISKSAWTALLHTATKSNLQLAISSDLADAFFSLACVPAGMKLPQQHLLNFPMPAEADGGMQPSIQQLLGAEEGFDVAAMRLDVAGALGELTHKFSSLGELSSPLATP